MCSEHVGRRFHELKKNKGSGGGRGGGGGGSGVVTALLMRRCKRKNSNRHHTCTRAKQLPAAKYIINSHYEAFEAIYTAVSVPGASMAGVSFDIDTSEPADIK